MLMVDSAEHLDLIENAARRFRRPGAGGDRHRLLSWRLLGGLVKIGPKRSPVRTAEPRSALAREIDRRKRVKLAGLMAYEGQIAGVGDNAPGRPLRNAADPRDAARSAHRRRPRRAEIVAAVARGGASSSSSTAAAPGSIERTAAEAAVTEIAAGSGFYAPVALRPVPLLHPAPRRRCSHCRWFAARRRGVVTALGGGYLASGVGAKDRMPVPYLPPDSSSTPSRAPARCRRRCSGRPPTGSRSATGSTSATSRRGSCASASTAPPDRRRRHQ